MAGYSAMVRFVDKRRHLNEHLKFARLQEKRRIRVQIKNAQRFFKEATTEEDRQFFQERIANLKLEFASK